MPHDSTLKETGTSRGVTARKHRCCMCGRAAEYFHVEDRPTSDNGIFKSWLWCAECWTEYRAGSDEELAAEI